MTRSWRWIPATLASLIIALGLGSCDEPDAPGPTPSMRFELAGVPFAAPFPSEHLRRDDGSIDLSAYRRERPTIVRQVFDALTPMRGFGTTSGVELAFEDAIDRADLPTGVVQSDDALVQLVVVDPRDPSRLGERAPIRLFFQEDGGPFGGTNVLTALPVQGIPLRAETLYALVVLRGIRTTSGALFGRAPALDALERHARPDGLGDDAWLAYQSAYEALGSVGIEARAVIGMAVFRTQDPVAGMRRAVETTDRALDPSGPFEPAEVFDDYCVFRTTIAMPVYQEGEPPYASAGGEWRWGERGLELDHEEQANLVVTLPRRPMPASGFPLTVLIRTGAGGDRPLVDRGRHAVAHGEAIEPGTGPARDFARVGWAGLSVDGPHGGLRNVTGGDEQFLVFNIQNPTALRDNLRQSALELVLLARSLDRFRVDATSCPGLEASEVRFDASRVALLGHSMGASIAPLAAAFEPIYRGLILSGAGASWIENILHKESPIATRPLAESLLGYGRSGTTLTDADPILNRLQWAGEEADAAVYAALLGRDAAPGDARHVLMFQGIVDTYIPPQVANALTIALGIDVAGDVIDRSAPRLTGIESVLDVLPLSGRADIPYPAHANLALPLQRVTAILAQHPGDDVEDGHEVMWQTEPPRAQIRCFLESFDDDAPTVEAPSLAAALCP